MSILGINHASSWPLLVRFLVAKCTKHRGETPPGCFRKLNTSMNSTGVVSVGKLTYFWWKKSCTTWDVENPMNTGISATSTGAGFLPSTVALENPPCWWYLMGKLVIFQCYVSLPEGISYCMYFQSIAFQQHCLNVHHPHRYNYPLMIKYKVQHLTDSRKSLLPFLFFVWVFLHPRKLTAGTHKLVLWMFLLFNLPGGTFFQVNPPCQSSG